jgi:hypothetical protein
MQDIRDVGPISYMPEYTQVVNLYSRIRNHDLPMQTVSGEALPAVWSINGRMRAGFDAGRKGAGLDDSTQGIALQGSNGASTFVMSGAGFMWG